LKKSWTGSAHANLMSVLIVDYTSNTLTETVKYTRGTLTETGRGSAPSHIECSYSCISKIHKRYTTGGCEVHSGTMWGEAHPVLGGDQKNGGKGGGVLDGIEHLRLRAGVQIHSDALAEPPGIR
jgi:hypothetical protein